MYGGLKSEVRTDAMRFYRDKVIAMLEAGSEAPCPPQDDAVISPWFSTKISCDRSFASAVLSNLMDATPQIHSFGHCSIFSHGCSRIILGVQLWLPTLLPIERFFG